MLRRIKNFWTIKRSGLFDPFYYLMKYPDVRRADIDPLMHFVKFGWKEGRNPSDNFEVDYYLATYPDVEASSINPLVHYIRHGRKYLRSICTISNALA